MSRMSSSSTGGSGRGRLDVLLTSVGETSERVVNDGEAETV